MKYLKYVFLLPLIIFFAGCNRMDNASLIERHFQFTMAIGKMEDQIDLIQLPGQPFQQSIDLVMKDGLFYVSNGAARKVMEFSSYGDLLTLYYNDTVNPVPILLGRDADDQSVVNRKAFAYPFSEVGNIAVTDSGMLLVQDAVAEDRQIRDADTGSMLRNIILRFDETGRLRDYIGQEGVSGTPFGFITAIRVGANDELDVVTRSLTGWTAFGFTGNGVLSYTFALQDDSLPAGDEGEVASIESVLPAPESGRLYVKADYYRDQLEGGAEQESDYRFDRSVLHWFDMRRGEIAGSLNLPAAVRTSGMAQMFNREEEEVIQYLAGAAEGGYVFLVAPSSEDIYSLAIVNVSGQVVHRGTIELNDSESLFREFYVTRDGILTALIGGNTGADVVLWRTDKFLGGAE